MIFFLCIYKADEVLKFDYFAFCSIMTTKSNGSAKRKADYAERCAAKGVTWLSHEDFTEYQQSWDEAKKKKNTHGGKREGAGAPKNESKESVQGAQITYWDVTAWCSRVGTDPRAWFEIIKPYFKSGGFQVEITPTTDALHFQGRFATFKRHRADSKEIAAIANACGINFMKPTAKCNMNDLNYQNKADTRVEGPWTMKSPPLLKVSDVTFVEEHYHQYPYCADLVQLIKSGVDPRDIVWIYDEYGKCAKSAVLAYLEYHLGLETLPYCDNYKDFMQFAHGFSGKRAYAVNVARGCAPTNVKERREFGQFIGGLESLKDGWLFDTRNVAKKDRMHRPHVIVFANCKPIFDQATMDRWKIFRITADMKFEDATVEIIEEWKVWRDAKRKEHDYKEALRLDSLRKRYHKAITRDPSVADYHQAATRRREDKESSVAEFRYAQSQHFERSASAVAMDAPHVVHAQSVSTDMAPLGGSSTDRAVVSVQDTKLVFEDEDDIES